MGRIVQIFFWVAGVAEAVINTIIRYHFGIPTATAARLAGRLLSNAPVREEQGFLWDSPEELSRCGRSRLTLSENFWENLWENLPTVRHMIKAIKGRGIRTATRKGWST